MSGILALLLGRRLCDRYRVDSVIATGGMGAVCRAFDLNLERDVAVKVVTAVAPDADEAGRLKARFHREATAAARLRHPNVVTVHDFGTDRELGIDFLVMELLAGEDLSARMRRAAGPLPVEEAVEILREGGMGLAAGHRAGMVHRDVKPANIYLVAEPGGWEVKVLDFGIAQVRQEAGETAARLTRFGAPHTPRYASPEQLAGGMRLTAASDIYSFALTGLEMLSGEHPGGLNTTGDDREAARAVKRLLSRRPEVPMRLAAVLRRALRLDPALRFADADAFLDALEEWDHAPPRDAASAAGYASILPSAPHSVPASALADDATEIAPRPMADGTMAAPPAFAIPHPPPVVFQPSAVAAPPAAPAQQPGDADAAAATEAAPKPRRRLRLRPAGWILLLLVLALAAAVLVWPHGPRGRIRSGGGGAARPSAETPQAPAGPAGGPQLAWAEWYRVTNGGAFGRGDTVFVVIIASFTADQMAEAKVIHDAVKAKGYDVGLANSSVYRELRDGYVALVAGPFATHEGAADALPDLRRDAAHDAFLKRVTLRRP
ncbi:MAG TPA: serine/threonine-protein kinase [Longimicrobium sp.]|nr:serine/threonine-protein kinase [Longimicrobium sp.]HSU17259.1 serine/threonine-protein kinase [Longimicrobium sp.]